LILFDQGPRLNCRGYQSEGLMKIRLLKNSPMGRSGLIRDADAPSAKVAFLLGLAEPYVNKSETEPEQKARRSYRRKDIASEPVFVAENPQPVVEDSDATIRLGD